MSSLCMPSLPLLGGFHFLPVKFSVFRLLKKKTKKCKLIVSEALNFKEILKMPTTPREFLVKNYVLKKISKQKCS